MRRPITLIAYLRCDHHEVERLCLGKLVYHGSQVHRACEDEFNDDHNRKFECAYDHGWSGSRELYVFHHRREAGIGSHQRAATNQWCEDESNAALPGSPEPGGPGRVSRCCCADHHFPNDTGYDMCVAFGLDPRP